MLRVGEYQNLVINRKVTFGFYLCERGESEEVLLPGGEIPDDSRVGEPVRVFLYRDSEDRLIATTRTPGITLGTLAVLAVKDTNKYGAFLDWGLSKDLFLPYREQTVKAEKGRAYLVRMYKDKSGRLCASMRVHADLEKNAPYKKDDRVQGIIYDSNPRFGLFVAVDSRYDALIEKKEDNGSLHVGDAVSARVTGVRDDGRLYLSVREKAYIQIDRDAEVILSAIERNAGVLPFTEKADPDLIKEKLHMSKAAFKRGVGHLLKDGKIVIREGHICLKD